MAGAEWVGGLKANESGSLSEPAGLPVDPSGHPLRHIFCGQEKIARVSEAEIELFERDLVLEAIGQGIRAHDNMARVE